MQLAADLYRQVTESPMQTAGVAFPFFRIIKEGEASSTSTQVCDDLFTKDVFRGLSSLGPRSSIPSHLTKTSAILSVTKRNTDRAKAYVLQWTEDGYRSFERWRDREEELQEMGPIVLNLVPIVLDRNEMHEEEEDEEAHHDESSPPTATNRMAMTARRSTCLPLT